MSDSPSGDPRASASADGPGILAGLPRTRPQRASARRVAARVGKPSATPPRQATKRAPAKTRARRQRREPAGDSAAAEERAPKQGFEAEPDQQGPVQPPGGTELVASAAEFAGELAKAGVSTGARVLRDLLSRLPG
jgi:hypothetical protein